MISPGAPGGRRGVARKRISAIRSSQGRTTRWRGISVVRRHQRRGGPPSLHACSSSLGASRGELGAPPRLLLPDLQARPIALAVHPPSARPLTRAPAGGRQGRTEQAPRCLSEEPRIIEPKFSKRITRSGELSQAVDTLVTVQFAFRNGYKPQRSISCPPSHEHPLRGFRRMFVGIKDDISSRRILGSASLAIAPRGWPAGDRAVIGAPPCLRPPRKRGANPGRPESGPWKRLTE